MHRHFRSCCLIFVFEEDKGLLPFLRTDSLEPFRTSGQRSKDGILFFKTAKEKDLEGIMAKHSGSHYRIGERSGKGNLNCGGEYVKY